MLAPDLATPAAMNSVAQRLLEAVTSAIAVDSHILGMRASIGAAGYPDHGDDMQTLMQRADEALYVAKRAGGGYRGYSPQETPVGGYLTASAGALGAASRADRPAGKRPRKVPGAGRMPSRHSHDDGEEAGRL